MWKKLVWLLLVLVLLAACTQGSPGQGQGQGQGSGSGQGQGGGQGQGQGGGQGQGQGQGQAQAQPTQGVAEAQPTTAAPTATTAQEAVQPAAPFPGLPLPYDRGRFFSGSGACTACHTKQTDQAGTDVSVDSQWRSSMMANTARDPYWLATVRSESIQAPQHAEVIQGECANCHTPMAEVTLVADGQAVPLLDQGLLAAAHPLHNLARDGVSCTLCHQIEPDNFEQPGLHSGSFLIDMQLPEGERLAYGLFPSGANLVTVMQSSSGFIPQQSAHVGQAEMCAACHDLYTPYLDAAGEIAGEFGEQLIYSEWKNSAYAKTTSCQACHMPQAQGSVKLSITGGPPRSPYYQHIFVGGNAFMLRMLQQNGQALQVSAAPEHFDASIARTEQQLSTKTATLTLDQARVSNGELMANVTIENLAGHKFPGGYPSRRAWLQVHLLDKDGKVIFESGAVEATGAVRGNDNDTDATRYESHYTLLTDPEQVQIYEAIMVNSDGEVTTTLLRGARYVKDNRLLPSGFQSNAEQPELDPQGEASLDANFTGGGDTLTLQLPLGQAPGPFTLEVSLLYQTIGFRWAENLLQKSGAEIDLFSQLYQALPNLPVIVATAQLTITP